jgi:hypothetical protein
MPENSISLQFNKMPTVTVDGKTQKFQADKADGYQSITEGGVTYSLVKDKDSGRYTMNISGEPAALEKYNFSVGKGRVTEGKFGGDSMENFFKGSVSVGDKKKADKDYFQNFSIAGGHLADKASFLQSGAWGLDQSSAEKELNRLEEEAEAAAKKAKEAEDAKKNSGTQEVGEQTQVAKTDGASKEDLLKSNQTQESPTTDKAKIKQGPSVTATSNAPLTSDEVYLLKDGLHENVLDSIDILLKAKDNMTLRKAFTEFKGGHIETAQKILTDKANTHLPNALSLEAKAKLTEANLNKLGLKAKATIGDGNCFFHAVADQGFFNQQLVRRQVAGEMSDIIRQPKNRDLPFPKGLGGNPPTKDQVDNTLLDASTAGSRAWGEDFHSAYVARAFDRPVVLIAFDRVAVYEKDKDVRTIESSSQIPDNAIFLSHKGGNHWESASRIQP